MKIQPKEFEKSDELSDISMNKPKVLSIGAHFTNYDSFLLNLFRNQQKAEKIQ